VSRLRARWLAVAIGLLATGVAAACAGAYGYPEFVPRIVANALDQFLEPGLALWWLTLGGPFQSSPAHWSGYCVTILGNTLLWLVALVPLFLAIRVVQRRMFRRRHQASPTIAPANTATRDP